MPIHEETHRELQETKPEGMPLTEWSNLIMLQGLETHREIREEER
jgi:hypothetical protein